MLHLDRPSRKTLIVAIVLLILLTTASVNFFITSTYSHGTVTETKVSAGYLENQHSSFENTTNDPWYCSCKEEEEEVEKQTEPHAEERPLIVPESFAPPPKAVLDKINANLDDGRVLTVATANYGMRNHVYNWIESLNRTGEEKYLIFCLDEQLYDHLVAAGYGTHASPIPVSWLHQDVEAGFEEYYSAKYRVITGAKTWVVQQLLYLDITVFFSDVDVVWMRPRLREFVYTFLDIRPETHVLFQQEGVDQRVVNSGFYMMRPENTMKRLLAHTIYLQDNNPTMTQQAAMNSALNHMDMDIRTSSVVLLDVLHFPNGFVYFTHDLPRRHGIEPFVVHANYLVGDDKRKKLKEHNLWYLDDDWLSNMDTQLEKAKTVKTNKKTDK
ncbi:hypothetical protein DFQ28_003416 [Apophysomyces sp. BC1034]|nr:hypothetical protein DFQ30_001477 [Apophysomyces sp. BC1015]KAG0182938.1 hypothetical protein DFQ29_001082 [Apophysomyces sp. BC1021]KAG0193745.1 hypothetical protein DFQ28_003416 [Apophysomyces sp. BC1034]